MAGILGLLMSGAGLIKDQYFNLTSLLLPGNGTNGAQNNTFLDSSTNNFTITRNGNTTQGTFSPFSQTGWGNYFTGSGSTYLSIASSADLQLTNSTVFTIEAFIYWTGTTGTQQGIISKRGSSATQEWGLVINSTGKLVFTNTTTDYTGGTTLNQNRWNHIAVSSDGTNIAVYLNGSRDSTPTAATGIVSSTNDVLIGYQTTTANPYTGYISNLRVVKGTQLYSGTSYTVPTATLTAVTNTSLLTCLSNRFVDTNTQTTAKTITVSGSPSVVAFSPFAPTAAYTTAAVGGSGYFDGTGDYLTAPSNIVDFAAGQAFTVECWVYLSSNTPAQAISANGANTFSLAISGGQVLYGKAGVIDVLVGTMAAANQWVHIAVGRNSSNTSRLWVNGTSVATSGSDTYSFNAATMYIGSNSTPAAYLNGYMAGLRVVKGSDVYGVANTSITVPTAPFTAITNTQLLLNYTNAGITDATAKNDLETVGNAQISTSVSKFGGGSIYLDGTSDYLSIPQTVTLAYGTGNFTVEFWLYRAGNVTVSDCGVIDQRDGGSGAYFMCGINTSQQFFVFLNSAYRIGPSASTLINQNTWYHIAYVRSSTTGTLYINGSSVGSWADNLNYVTNKTLIGRHSGGGTDFNGYLDDIRITNGYARYTGNFTPPTAPFPVQ